MCLPWNNYAYWLVWAYSVASALSWVPSGLGTRLTWCQLFDTHSWFYIRKYSKELPLSNTSISTKVKVLWGNMISSWYYQIWYCLIKQQKLTLMVSKPHVLYFLWDLLLQHHTCLQEDGVHWWTTLMSNFKVPIKYLRKSHALRLCPCLYASSMIIPYLFGRVEILMPNLVKSIASWMWVMWSFWAINFPLAV